MNSLFTIIHDSMDKIVPAIILLLAMIPPIFFSGMCYGSCLDKVNRAIFGIMRQYAKVYMITLIAELFIVIAICIGMKLA